LVGACDAEEYPLQKKHHTLEFLRDIAHLRPRTNTIGAVTRVRHAASRALINYFEEEGFVQVHTPVITASDCEGAGEMFQVSSKGEGEEGFFGSDAFLSVSGQLQAEMFACALSRVFSFGPTFRAENSNTSRHLSEFWMVEPEMAWASLEDAMQLAEGCVQASATKVLNDCPDDIDFFTKRVDKSVTQRLDSLATGNAFLRASYSECIRALEQHHATAAFEKAPAWGIDLSSEHERWLTDQYYKGPVFVTDWPREVKPFYMRVNDDQQTVAAMDLLVPGMGELAGGSAREERIDVLEARMAELGVHDIQWYSDLRRFGTVPHAGFGLGFERLMLYLTGLSNVRDVIPVPRHPSWCKF